MKPVIRRFSSLSKDDYGAAKVREYFGSKKASFSLAFVEYDGRFPEKNFILNHKCNETYFIIEGSFEIEIKGDKRYRLKKFDSLCVPKGSKYSIKGIGKLISINDPPWDLDQFEEGIT